MMNLMMFNMFLSLTFLFMSHPLSMGMILLTQTILISLTTGNLNLNFWFSYIIFIIMVGGLLILFIYMTSVASNEKFKTNWSLLLATSLMMMMMTLLTNNLFMNLANKENMKFNMNNLFNLTMNKFINYPMSIILMFSITYLLICLIATVKITNLTYGPLRQNN